MEIFYFGPASQPLLGIYHEPAIRSRRDCGVILCYPMGHEYIQFHRAYRHLADDLSRLGFPVLRFDFYGCGDSSGESDEGRLPQWVADTNTAIAEIKRRSGVMNLCLVGLRLGGTLSLMVGAERHDIDGLVLWDPVVRGQAYLEELNALHREMLRRAHVRIDDGPSGQEPIERLGFPYSTPLLADLEPIDLLAIEQRPTNKILLIASHPRARHDRFGERLLRLGITVESQSIPSPHLWAYTEAFTKVQVPYQIRQSITSWMSRVYP